MFTCGKRKKGAKSPHQQAVGLPETTWVTGGKSGKPSTLFLHSFRQEQETTRQQETIRMVHAREKKQQHPQQQQGLMRLPTLRKFPEPKPTFLTLKKTSPPFYDAVVCNHCHTYNKKRQEHGCSHHDPLIMDLRPERKCKGYDQCPTKYLAGKQ